MLITKPSATKPPQASLIVKTKNNFGSGFFPPITWKCMNRLLIGFCKVKLSCRENFVGCFMKLRFCFERKLPRNIISASLLSTFFPTPASRQWTWKLKWFRGRISILVVGHAQAIGRTFCSSLPRKLWKDHVKCCCFNKIIVCRGKRHLIYSKE